MPATVAGLARRLAGVDRVGLLFEDQSWTHAEVVQAAAERAALMGSLLPAGAPPHVGVLLDNVPEFVFWLLGAALARAVVVGVNPTRRGAELAGDVAHAECQLVVSEPAHLDALDALDRSVHLLDVESDEYRARLAAVAGAPLPAGEAEASDLFLLLFTSGTAGAPKAVRCSQGRLAGIAEIVAGMFELGPADVCYLAMPMFHSNALMAGWGPALAGGAAVALRRRFSASGFLPDVRRYGATYFNYVGKPLSYVLATPERPDDADNPLRRVFGNEAADLDIARFAARFGCRVVDGYGSTEGGATVQRTPDMPPGALGRAPEGTVVLDPATGEECPPARFSASGELLNPDQAIGELVNKQGGLGFEGYWNNEEAERARLRNGWYWTGDLAYRDADGFFYFAGRDVDWLRVDGENFAAAPVERILARFPGVVLASVYAVPDPHVGDQMMAALELRPGTAFDPSAFGRFLAAQPDLGTKWAPRFVRVCPSLPITPTAKVLKRQLQAEGWSTTDPVWWRPYARGATGLSYVPFTADDAATLPP
jgi:fatty-acyl-CoA synthase